MILDIGKIYNFYYSWPEGSRSQRGKVTAIEGPLVKIEDEHGREELINLCHIMLESVREYDESKLADFTIVMPAANLEAIDQ